MDSTLIIIGIIAVAFIVIAKLILARGGSSTGINYAYESREYLLTKAELTFFHALEKAVGNQYKISSKVRLEDIIKVKRGLDKKEAYGLRGRIKSRHIDFVLCDPTDLSIQICLELDDSSHNRPDRQKRDVFVNRAMAAAGVRLMRVPAQRSYEKEMLTEILDQGLTIS